MLLDYGWEAAAFLMRCLHVVAAIAWIGESFYFVALDRGLQSPAQSAKGLFGESWSVHGGGFYLKQKFMPAPAELPETLHWSKWKSYTTWLSGFGLLSLTYFLHPEFHLIDANVADWSNAQAIGLALVFLFAGYAIYDLLCHLFQNNEGGLSIAVMVFVVVLVGVLHQTFAPRAAFLLSGAVLGTLMSANVFFVIIPGQKRLVAALQDGRAPVAADGMRGKQRSTHNTYFTLPVVFAMLSAHFAPAYTHPYAWLVLLLMMLAGVMIREFFVQWHSGRRQWLWLIASAATVLATAAWCAPKAAPVVASIGEFQSSAATLPASQSPVGARDDYWQALPAPSTNEVESIFKLRCHGCHAAKPTLLAAPPKGVVIETLPQIEQQRMKIQLQLQSRIMPPGNLTGLSEAERAAVLRWSSNLEKE